MFPLCDLFKYDPDNFEKSQIAENAFEQVSLPVNKFNT